MLDEEVSFRVIKVDANAGEIKDYALKKLSLVNSFVGHNVDETSGLVIVPNYNVVDQVGESSQVVNTEKGESSQVVNTNKGKWLLMYNGDEQEKKGGASSSEDDANNVTFDDSEDKRALELKIGLRKNKMNL